MLDLDQIQSEAKVGTDHNFPDAIDSHPLVGAVEEIGELCHAWLKEEQGIRGTDHDNEARDAIGDVIIYLLHFCIKQLVVKRYYSTSMESCQPTRLEKNPENGKT